MTRCELLYMIKCCLGRLYNISSLLCNGYTAHRSFFFLFYFSLKCFWGFFTYFLYAAISNRGWKKFWHDLFKFTFSQKPVILTGHIPKMTNLEYIYMITTLETHSYFLCILLLNEWNELKAVIYTKYPVSSWWIMEVARLLMHNYIFHISWSNTPSNTQLSNMQQSAILTVFYLFRKSFSQILNELPAQRRHL